MVPCCCLGLLMKQRHPSHKVILFDVLQFISKPKLKIPSKKTSAINAKFWPEEGCQNSGWIDRAHLETTKERRPLRVVFIKMNLEQSFLLLMDAKKREEIIFNQTRIEYSKRDSRKEFAHSWCRAPFFGLLVWLVGPPRRCFNTFWWMSLGLDMSLAVKFILYLREMKE